MMQRIFAFTSNKNRTEIFSISVVILLFLFRSDIPVLNYLFIASYLSLIVYYIAFYFKAIVDEVYPFIKRNPLLILLLIFYLSAFCLSNKYYISVIKDIVSTFILFSFFFLLSLKKLTSEDFRFFSDCMLVIIPVIAFLITFYNIISILVIHKSDYFIFTLYQPSITYYDHNFALLPSFFAFTLIFYAFHKNRIEKYKLLYVLLLLFFTMHFILSGSRRGVILFTILLVFLICGSIYQLFINKNVTTNLKKITGLYLSGFAILMLSLFLFVFKTGPDFKNKILKSIGSQDVIEAKRNISNSTYKSLKLFDRDLDYLSYYNSHWLTFDSSDPDMGWGSRIHSTIFPLSGKNVGIVPRDAKGYQIDSTCQVAYDEKRNLYDLFTYVHSINVKAGERFAFNVFCNVDSCYNGDDVNVSVYGTGIKERIYYKYRSDFYDFSRKGSWQKLTLNFDCNDGVANFCVTVLKKGSEPFSKLKGKIIFAYPKVEKISESSPYSISDFKDPDSGWGTRTHRTIFPLTGNNVFIVPSGARGYLMDSTCNSSYYPESDIAESYTVIKRINSAKHDQFISSAYCFVSEDYDGDDVGLIVYGTGKGNQLSMKYPDRAKYNLSDRGTWQKLELPFDCNDGEITFCLSFIKRKVKDFSSLKGYVIFACPSIEKVDAHSYEKALENSSTSWNVHSQLIENEINGYPISPNKIEGEVTVTDKIENKVGMLLCKESGLSTFMLPLSFSEVDQLKNLNRFKSWIKKVITEDTTYKKPKSKFVVDSRYNEFGEDRMSRWRFALSIFKNEYNISEKLFGGGFAFLNWYGNYFLNDKTQTDYPHNPFLYILLYSGIAGLLLYCIVLFYALFYYLKYIKESGILFIFFLITFFFTFFSGGQPFDPTVMGFFLFIPFFINSILRTQVRKGFWVIPSLSEDTLPNKTK